MILKEPGTSTVSFRKAPAYHFNSKWKGVIIGFLEDIMIDYSTNSDPC